MPAPDRSGFERGLALAQAGQLVEAEALFRAAAEGGLVEAMLLLADVGLRGGGWARDPADAVHWLTRAVEAGSASAARLLAAVHASGHGVPADDSRAMEWLELAVAAEHPAALRDLGLLLWSGGEQDLAVRVLRRAAQRGEAFAQHALGTVSDPTLGVSAAEADAWRALAAAAGLPVAEAAEVAVPPESPVAPQLPRDPLAVAEALRTVPIPRIHEGPTERLAPIVDVRPGLLGPLVCDYLMTVATPYLDRSRTNDPATGRPVPDPARTSWGMNFAQAFPDLIVNEAERRIAAFAGRPLSHAEPLAVLRYEAGQEYRHHHDFMAPQAIAEHPFYSRIGQREVTVVTYLNRPREGGQTEFPRLGLTIEPEQGMGVRFDNVGSDGEPEVDSLHAGLPVTAGEKWVCTLWFRERETRHHIHHATQ